MTSILIIDDDIHIGNAIQEVLMDNNYQVLRAFSGTEAQMLLSRQMPDLILLDLMLPGLSGEELLPQINEIPVIVLSAKTDVNDKVNLLLHGAADYVTKPFHTKELLARIAVQLRQNVHRTSGNQLHYHNLTLHTDTHEVYYQKKLIHLTRTEYAILKLLMTRPNQILSKTMLLEYISTDTPDCTESSLKTHMSHLRTKLMEISGTEYIETIWGIGFRMKNLNEISTIS